MTGEFSLLTKDVECTKKLWNWSISSKQGWSSFFSKFLMKFLINDIKYLVSTVVSGALSGAIKIELLRSMTMESSF